MTLTIELTPDEEARLQAVARERGVETTEYARQWLLDSLPHANGSKGMPPPRQERDPELVARVHQLKGKYAHLNVTSEDLRRERNGDDARDEAKWAEQSL